MEWSSGFFASPEEVGGVSSYSFEQLGCPNDGCFELFRGNAYGRNRAFKAIRPEYRGIPLYEDLLKKEYEIGSSMDHPNIRHYLRYGNVTGLGNAIEMEWIDGVTLDEFHGSRKEFRKLIGQLCGALSYIHGKQVIHRDIKPSNLLVTHNGNNLKIIDFGFSDADCYTLLKTPAGTLEYAAPELIRGEDVDFSCDIWSVGVIIRKFLPRSFGVASRCNRIDRRKRFRSVEEVARALKTRPVVTAILVTVVLMCAIWSAVHCICTISECDNTEGSAIVEAADSLHTVENPETSIEDIFKEATELILDADRNRKN